GKIAVIENEAERVRLIYRRYLELGGVNALVQDLKDKNIRTKIRLLATGGQIQGRHPARQATSDHGPRSVRWGSAEAHGSMVPSKSRQSQIRSFIDGAAVR